LATRGLALEARGVALAFGGVRAVDGVDLEVREREIAAIIGPNGAGKTSLFNAISGVFIPDAGTVRFCERDVTRLANWKRIRMGMGRTFQTPSIFPELTVAENLQVGMQSAMGLAQRLGGLGAERRRALVERSQELLGFVQLERFGERTVAQLSHGDQRLVEIAMSLSTSPTFVLLDEPTAGLAEADTSRVMEVVRDLHERLGLTVLFVEHNMRFVAQLADRVTVMNRGKVLLHGPPATVLADPQVREAYLGTEELALV
ncbi:MAG: ABC transporter ATP-binding protein, partial [Vulcanimicrobiaceae bacterium]